MRLCVANILDNNYLEKRTRRICTKLTCISALWDVGYMNASVEETGNKTVPRMPTSPKVCACTTLGNLKCHIEPSTQQLSVHLNDFIPPALWPPNSPNLNPVDYTVWSMLQERVDIVSRSRTSTNWNDASSASGPLWVTRLLTVLLESGVSVYTRLHSCWRRTFWAHAKIKIVWCDTYDSDYFERQKLSVMFVAIRLIIQMVTNVHLFATHHCHSLFFVTASRLICSSNSCGVCDSEWTPDKYSN